MFPIVEIFWEDAHVSSGEISVGKAAKGKPVLTRSVGYLIGENDRGLTIVSDQYPGNEKDGRVHSFIGWGMITEWYYLEDQRRTTRKV